MKLLLVGANGFLGSAVREAARTRGIEVLCTTRKEFELGVDSPAKLPPCDAAVIAAAVTNIKACHDNPTRSRHVNVDATIGLMERLRRKGSRVVWFSSSAVFDGTRGNYNETDGLSPVCDYGRQKADVERWCAEHLPDALVLRLGKGIDEQPLPSGKPTGGHLLMDFFNQCQSGEPLRCIRGLKYNPTAARDIADCVLLALGKGLAGLHNLSNSETLTRYEAAKVFVEVGGMADYQVSEVDASVFNFAEPRALDTTLNNAKFLSAVGGYKFTTYREVVERFWRNAQCKQRTQR